MDFEEIKKLSAAKQQNATNVKKKPFYKSPFDILLNKDKTYMGQDDLEIPSMMRRSFAFGLDMLVATSLRLACFMFLLHLYIKPVFLSISAKAKAVGIVKASADFNTKPFADFLIKELLARGHLTTIFFCILAIYLLGILYYVFAFKLGEFRFFKFLPFSHSACKLVVVDAKTMLSASLWQRFVKYYSGILPFVASLLITRILFGFVGVKLFVITTIFVFFAWYDLAIKWFNTKQSASDMLAGTIVLRKVKK